MPAKKLPAADVGLPRFEFGPCESVDVFGLSSHRRAREALEFALSINAPGFNAFVLGEDRSGRMSATIAFLEQAVAQWPRPNDWVYLNNFRRPHRPRPCRLPAGVGRRFRDRMAALVPQIREALEQAFTGETFQKQIHTESEAARSEVARRYEALQAEAGRQGLDLTQTPQGGMSLMARSDENGNAAAAPPAVGEEDRRRIAEQLAETNRWAAARRTAFTEWARTLEREIAEQATDALFDALVSEFSHFAGLARWLTEMRIDVLDGLARFRMKSDEEAATAAEPPERRYAVNLLVDHSDDSHPGVVVEANPSYETLFGRVDYEQAKGALRTDFTLIRAGSLHRANGGILVLRADALANDARLWGFLKAALRDQKIRIEEPHRTGTMPLAGAPRPKPIPLDVKIVIIGAARWYYTAFSVDPDFQTHFKVKADIDTDMDATPQNLACYAALIRGMTAAHQGATCEAGALTRLLGIAARWAGRRDKLTAQFERIEDLISEALQFQGGGRPAVLSEQAVIDAVRARRHRNARVEDRLHENIARGLVMIDTSQSVVGQVNALTVRDLGDHAFGAPTRVTARASVGRLGVINVERDTTLGGPIQQKGVMVMQGFLAGHFARRIPLSFNCSITFEQSYGGIEGDSASIAELLAILSDLADIPLRQDLAITGSVNQRGQAQAVGGIHHKIEGFFRCCVDAGGLSGTQGVAIPAANEADLVLRDEIAEAVAAGRFHVWSIATVEEAIELFTGHPAGERDADGLYPPDSVYSRVAAELATFDRILTERIQG